MDFGFAKSGNSGLLTVADKILGTPAYMSPEQAEGKLLDGRSDLYSLALVFYESLCGRQPFEATEPLAQLVERLQREATPISKHLPGVDPELEAVLVRALARDREQRFGTAEEMRRVARRFGPTPAFPRRRAGRGGDPRRPGPGSRQVPALAFEAPSTRRGSRGGSRAVERRAVTFPRLLEHPAFEPPAELTTRCAGQVVILSLKVGEDGRVSSLKALRPDLAACAEAAAASPSGVPRCCLLSPGSRMSSTSSPAPMCLSPWSGASGC